MSIEINVPGSKSIANRVLVINHLAKTKAVLENLPDCDDTNFMLKGLKAFSKKTNAPIKIYTGNAGTTTRFLTALATLAEKKVIINGDKRMQERPIKELTSALNKLGAKITTTKGCPPVEISPKKPNGGSISLPGNISSQYLTALLLIAGQFEKNTTIKIEQELCSKPYINVTIKTLESFGIKLKNKKFEQFEIQGAQQIIPPKKYVIESDASSASYIGAFAAINPTKNITLLNIHKNSLQGDIAFIKHLEKMGCKVTHPKKGTKIKGPKKLNTLGQIDMNKTPDLVMTFAVLAMFTPGKTKITNIENLRIKETDRISALENEIKKFGIIVKTGKDYIEIIGDPQHLKEIKNAKINIKTYNDHRIAMCFGMIRNKFTNLKIQNPNCVKKSYPTFWDDLKKLENEL